MSAQKQVPQMGVRVFVKVLAQTIAEFREIPLDDRDADWILNRLKALIYEETLRMDLTARDKASLKMMYQRLEWYVIVQDLKVDYQDDQ